MDLIMTMFKPRSSTSPGKISASSPRKRDYDSSSLDEDSPPPKNKKKQRTSAGAATNTATNNGHRAPKEKEPRFTFDEVKTMIENVLNLKRSQSCTSLTALKSVNFEEIAVPGHGVQSCKDLLEQLVKNTRRTRTLYEVLEDVKNNLKKQVYTNIIQRASIDGDVPRRPPSAYLIFHQERYNELKHEHPLAAEVSKIVSSDWKKLSERQRQVYHKLHDEAMEKYYEDMERLGLIDQAAPKRPKSAKGMFIDHKIKKLKLGPDQTTRLAEAKEKYGREFDQMDENDKRYWLEKSKNEKEKFYKEREEYVAAHPHLNHAPVEPPKPRGREPKVQPPKAPLSALKFFLQKKMPQGLEGTEYDETKRRLKEKFHSLSEKKLLRFIKKAVKDRERYDEELAQFKLEHPGVEIPKLKPSITKEQLKLYATRVENRPVPPAPTAYLHYCGKTLSDMHVDETDTQAPTNRMRDASKNWKNASDDEKAALEKEHKQAIASYIEAMDAWLSQQTEARKQKLLAEDPKSQPDYWRKRLNRLVKAETKKSKSQSRSDDSS